MVVNTLQTDVAESSAATKTPSETHRLTHRTGLLIVFLVVFVDLLGFGMVLPLVPVYAEHLLGGYSTIAANAILGLLMTCFSLMQFVFSPYWGKLSDRVGRRPILLLGLAGSTTCYGLFGLACFYGSLTGMFLSRIGAGIMGATIGTAQAYIADVTPPQRRASGMALIGAAFGLGFTFGPLLGAGALLLSDARGAALSPWPGLVGAAFSGLALALAFFKLRESLPAALRGKVTPAAEIAEASAMEPAGEAGLFRILDIAVWRETARHPVVLLLLLTTFIAVFALAGFEATLSVTLAALLGVEHGGAPLLAVFSLIGFIQTIVQGFIVRPLARRWSEGRLAAIGLITAIGGFLLMASAAAGPWASPTVLISAAGVVAAGMAFVVPAVQGLLSRHSAEDHQGRVFGLANSLSAVARIVGVLAAFQLRGLAASLPFWSAAGLLAITWGVLRRAIRVSAAKETAVAR
ncbi:MFS transporter [Thermopirellula anaerolimosa]